MNNFDWFYEVARALGITPGGKDTEELKFEILALLDKQKRDSHAYCSHADRNPQLSGPVQPAAAGS